MATELKVRPEIADKLTALAEARGISVEDLLGEVLNELQPPDATTEASLEEFDRDMDLLAEGLEHLPVEYQGTYSREDIYVDHD
ncbi:MAG TPA: hypothetical protein VFV34_11345 [Blastocatellia bacterium]|nr:hypothetical protein [Blastocatellia bacterium]